MKKLWLSALILCGFSTSVLAHHSGAMFNEDVLKAYQGTVTKWQWTNPHSFLYLNIKDENGVEKEYQFETGSPNTMYRNGWRKDSFKPGDVVAIYAYPLREGDGGMMVTARTADGQGLQWLPAGATQGKEIIQY